jgi:hypothetical protein
MKSRIGTIGLSVVMVLAVSAMITASASAVKPEFITAGFPVGFTSSNILPVEPSLHTAALGGTEVVCKMAEDEGEVTTVIKFANVKITYTQCQEGGTTNPCTSAGQPMGTVKTKVLRGLIGYVEPMQKLVGAELEPESGTVIAEFTCTGGAKTVTVEGCTIGELTPVAAPLAPGILLFEEAAGKQKWVELKEGRGVHKPCELTVTATLLKLKGKGWIVDKEKEVFGAPIEVK